MWSICHDVRRLYAWRPSPSVRFKPNEILQKKDSRGHSPQWTKLSISRINFSVTRINILKKESIESSWKKQIKNWIWKERKMKVNGKQHQIKRQQVICHGHVLCKLLKLKKNTIEDSKFIPYIRIIWWYRRVSV